MEHVIKELIRLNIEIEGLLRVIESRDTEYARSVLSEKMADFNALYSSLSQSNSKCNLEASAETQIRSTEEKPQGTNDKPEKSHDVESGTTDVDDEQLNISEQQVSNVTENQEPIEDDQLQANFESTLMSSQEVSGSHDEGRGDSLRMDEMLSRREAQDLRRAFTLNDKFRYRRELFGSNDALFADTLNTLSTMHSLGEALDFLYKDMGWDPEDDNVKDFVATITNHFSAIK